MSGLTATSDTTIEMTLVAPIGQTLFENYVAGPQVLPMPSGRSRTSMPTTSSRSGTVRTCSRAVDQHRGTLSNDTATRVRRQGRQIDFRFYADNDALWADLQANTWTSRRTCR